MEYALAVLQARAPYQGDMNNLIIHPMRSNERYLVEKLRRETALYENIPSWSEDDEADNTVVYCAWQGDELVATMRTRMFEHASAAFSALSLRAPEHVTGAAAVLQRACTSPGHRQLGANTVIRRHVLAQARALGMKWSVGVVEPLAPRVASMHRMGYAFFPIRDIWRTQIFEDGRILALGDIERVLTPQESSPHSSPTIHQLRQDDADELLALRQQVYGRAHAPGLEELDYAALGGAANCVLMGIRDKANHALIAAGRASFHSKDELPMGFRETPASAEMPRGVLQRMIVHSKHRRRGYAGELGRARMRWLLGQGVSVVHAIHAERRTSSLRRLGFELGYIDAPRPPWEPKVHRVQSTAVYDIVATK